MMSAPLTVVVPTLNEENYIGRLLDSLQNQVGDPSFDVVIVDSSNDNLTVNAANQFRKSLDIRTVSVKVQDIGTQRNIGWRQTNAPKVLFLDADVSLHPGTLKHLSTTSFGEKFVVSARHVSDQPRASTDVALLFVHFIMFVCISLGLPVTNGDFIFTSRRTLNEIGGFKEGYLLGEDTDFGVRARRVGAKPFLIWHLPVTASSRRLQSTSVVRLIRIWITAFIRVLVKGPTPKSSGIDYPFGKWRD